MGQWQVAKGPEFAHISSFSPKGLKLSLFLLYGQWFSKMRAHFQNCHMWAWNMASGQSSRSCLYTLFLPQKVKIELTLIELIFAVRAAVSKIQAILPYLGMKLGKWPKFQTLHMYPLAAAEGWNLSSFCSMGNCFQDTGQFSKIAIFEHETETDLSGSFGKKWCAVVATSLVYSNSSLTLSYFSITLYLCLNLLNYNFESSRLYNLLHTEIYMQNNDHILIS